MNSHLIQLTSLAALALCSCATFQNAPTQTPRPSPTSPPQSETPSPTETATPTQTALPPTPTATHTATTAPQAILLRRACGRDHIVRANETIELFYGGWGVKGHELAQQWVTAVTADLVIDGLPVDGKLQPPAPDLPHNCPEAFEDSYWLYHRAVITELAPGTHNVTVAINALEPLPDGYGLIYGPGQIAKQTFRITAE